MWDGGKENIDNEEDNSTFLGLGIVSVEELQIASTSRHVIPLQGRPYFSTDENNEDNIHGLLTVEFALIEKKYSKTSNPLLGSNELNGTSRNREQGKHFKLIEFYKFLNPY